MMARGSATFKQHDVTRAVKGAEAAGKIAERVEIDRAGKIIVTFKGGAGETPDIETPASGASKIVL
jgi:hypothetical protein